MTALLKQEFSSLKKHRRLSEKTSEQGTFFTLSQKEHPFREAIPEKACKGSNC